eukprot:3070120-Pleurochrysis_carterae.AAC.2
MPCPAQPRALEAACSIEARRLRSYGAHYPCASARHMSSSPRSTVSYVPLYHADYLPPTRCLYGTPFHPFTRSPSPCPYLSSLRARADAKSRSAAMIMVEKMRAERVSALCPTLRPARAERAAEARASRLCAGCD